MSPLRVMRLIADLTNGINQQPPSRTVVHRSSSVHRPLWWLHGTRDRGDQLIHRAIRNPVKPSTPQR